MLHRLGARRVFPLFLRNFPQLLLPLLALRQVAGRLPLQVALSSLRGALEANDLSVFALDGGVRVTMGASTAVLGGRPLLIVEVGLNPKVLTLQVSVAVVSAIHQKMVVGHATCSLIEGCGQEGVFLAAPGARTASDVLGEGAI